MTLAPCCIFEDAQIAQLWPMATTKPLVELWVGTSTILQKYIQFVGVDAISLSLRADLAETARYTYPNIPINRPNHAAPMWFINSRAWISPAQWAQLKLQDPKSSVAILSDNQVVALWLQHPHVEKAWDLLATQPDNANILAWVRSAQIPTMVQDVFIANAPWDWLAKHKNILEQELVHSIPLGVIQGKVAGMTSLIAEHNIYIAEDVHIEDFVVIDASLGPVVIAAGARIEAYSRLEGPLYIGPKAQILGGKITTSSIGPCAKVSGEVSKSIVSGFSNKAHYGYLGDSWVGAWVNLGAGTTTSNLKNTYATVQISDPKTGEKRDAGTQFLGSLIGDHTKTGIGTLLNTGTLVGTGCNLVGEAVHSGTILDLKWGKADHYTPYRKETFFKTVKAMMDRRNIVFTEAEKSLFETLFKTHWGDAND